MRGIGLLVSALVAGVFAPMCSAQSAFRLGTTSLSIPNGPGASNPNNCAPTVVVTGNSNLTTPITDVAISIDFTYFKSSGLDLYISYQPTGGTETFASLAKHLGCNSPDCSSVNVVVGERFFDGFYVFGEVGANFYGAAPTGPSTSSQWARTAWRPRGNNFNGVRPVIRFSDVFGGLPGTGTWRLYIKSCGVAGPFNGTFREAWVIITSEPAPCLYDYNRNGTVDTPDLVTFLAQFGQPCN